MTIQDERTASLVAALQKASLPSDVTDPNITYHERIQQKQASSQEQRKVETWLTATRLNGLSRRRSLMVLNLNYLIWHLP
jgi:hypothetical protein